MPRPYFPARSWTVSSSTTLSRRFPIGSAIVTAWPTLVPSSDLPRGDAIDDPDELPVSMASPLGKSLLGTKVGQAVTIALPMGKRRLKVVELETVHDLAEKRD